MWNVLIYRRYEIGIDVDVLGLSDLGVTEWLSLRKLVVRSTVVDHRDRSRNRELGLKVRMSVGVRGNKKGGGPCKKRI